MENFYTLLYVWIALLILFSAVITILLLKNGKRGKGITCAIAFLIIIPISIIGVQNASLFTEVPLLMTSSLYLLRLSLERKI